MPDQQAFSDTDLAGRVRTKYPHVYDDIPDAQLAQLVKTKRPDLVSDLMAQPQTGSGPKLPTSPMGGVDNVMRAVGKKALLPFEPTFDEPTRLKAASFAARSQLQARPQDEQMPLTDASYGNALGSIADSFRNATSEPSYSIDPKTGKKTYGTSNAKIIDAMEHGGKAGLAEGAMGISPADWLSLAASAGGSEALSRMRDLWKTLDIGDPLVARAINAVGTVMPKTASVLRNASGVEERMKTAADVAKSAAKTLGKKGTVILKAEPAASAAPEAAGAAKAAEGAAASEAAAPAATASAAASGQASAAESVPKPFNGTRSAVQNQADAEAFDRVANRNGMAQNVVGHTPASEPSPKVKLSAKDLLEKSRELSGSTARGDAAFKTTTDTAAGNKQFATQVKEVATGVGGKGGQRPLVVAASDAVNPKLSPEEQYAGIKRVADYAKANPWLRPADLVKDPDARKKLLAALAKYYETAGQ